MASTLRRAISRFNWVLVGLVAAPLIAVGAILAILLSIDPRRYANEAAELVLAETGRELKLAGAVELRLSASPRIVMEDVSFANAPWGSRPDMARLRRVELQIALLPLLHGEVRIARLALIEPDVLLERDGQGRANWDFGAAAGGAGGTPAGFSIGSLYLENAMLVFADHAAGRRTQLKLDRASLQSKEGAGGELRLDLAGAFDGRRIGLQGTLGGVADFLADRPWPVALAAEVDGAKATVLGRVARPRELAGLDLMADVTVSDLAAAAALPAGALPRLPPIRATARLRDEENGYRAQPFALALGDSRIAGGVSFERKGARARVDARLASPLIDLSLLSRRQKAARTKAEGAEGRVFSAQPLPLAPLRSLDANLDLRVDKIILPGGGHALESVALKAALERGRLSVDPANFSSAGGRVAARIELDASSDKTAKLSAHVDGRGLLLGALMAMMGRPQAIKGGRTDLRIDAAGSGNSVRAFLSGVSGHVFVSVGEATIEGRGLDLGADVLAQMTDALNPTLKSDPSMHLQCLVLNVPVRNGLVTLDNRAAAETTKVGIVAQGSVNLATEALDFAARSKAREGIGTGLANFSGVARVEGTLAHPRLGVDARGAAEAAATVGAALSTGGLSLLYQGLFNKVFPDHPCRDALAGAAAQRASAKKEPGLFERLFGK